MNSVNKQIGIQLILNTGNRLEPFRELFTWMARNGYGKFNETSSFCAATDVTLTPKNETEVVFASLQNEAFKAGFKYNCYCFNMRF